MKWYWLSIILPIYNAEKYIDNCLKSIIYQISDDVEIVLVDDGSKDNSGKICDKYVEKYGNIKVLHKKNEGAYQARIDGVKISKGDYIWFVDSDDWIMTGSINKLKQMIYVSNCADTIIFGYCKNGDGINASCDNIDKGLYCKEQFDIFYDKLICSSSLNSVWRKCIKRRLIVDNPEIVDIKNYGFGEDIYISCSVIDMCDNIYVSDDILYSYRDNEHSVTHVYNAKRSSQEKITISKLEYFAHKWDSKEKKGLTRYIPYRVIKEWFGNISLLILSNIDDVEKMNLLDKLIMDDFFLSAVAQSEIVPNVWWEKIFYKSIKKDPKDRKFVKKYIILMKLRNLIG